MIINPKLEEILSVVASMHGLTRSDLKCHSRKHCLSHPRQEAMYLARKLTRCSYPQIGQHFGGRDHTTVLFAYRKVAAQLKTDDKLAARLEQCCQIIAEMVTLRAKALGLPAGSSTEWSPPAPLQLAKPDRVFVSFGERAFVRRGGELEAAA